MFVTIADFTFVEFIYEENDPIIHGRNGNLSLHLMLVLLSDVALDPRLLEEEHHLTLNVGKTIELSRFLAFLVPISIVPFGLDKYST